MSTVTLNGVTAALPAGYTAERVDKHGYQVWNGAGHAIGAIWETLTFDGCFSALKTYADDAVLFEKLREAVAYLTDGKEA